MRLRRIPRECFQGKPVMTGMLDGATTTARLLAAACFGTLALVFAFPALAANPVTAPGRRLLLAGSNNLRPVLAELCKRAGGGDLKAKYTEVLLIGETSSLAQLQSAEKPGKIEESNAALLNLLRTVESDTTVCPEGTSQRRQIAPPADLLLLEREFTASDRVNIQLKLFATDGTIDKTSVLKRETMIAVNLMEVREVQAAVGCVGWAVWDVNAWLRPDAHCSKYNLRDEPVVIQAGAQPTAEVRRYPALVAPVIAGAGVLLGVAGYVVYASGRSKRDQILDGKEHGTPYDEANDNFAALGNWGAGMMVTGGIAVASGVALYLIDRHAVTESRGSARLISSGNRMDLSWSF
jgi:hypothetical protein